MTSAAQMQPPSNCRTLANKMHANSTAATSRLQNQAHESSPAKTVKGVYQRQRHLAGNGTTRSQATDLPRAPSSSKPGVAPPTLLHQLSTPEDSRYSVHSTNVKHAHSTTNVPFRQRANSVLSGIKGIIKKQRPRSDSIGEIALNSESGTDDMLRSLIKVKARRHAERFVSDNDLIGNDPSYEPYEEQWLDDDNDQDQQDFRPRSYSNDLMIMRKTSRPMTVEVLGSLRVTENPYAQYLRALNCYDMAPSTGEVVILDTMITIQRGFAALLQEADRVGLLFDSTRRDYVSLISQTDFLMMLVHSYKTKEMGLHLRPMLWWVTVIRSRQQAEQMPTSGLVRHKKVYQRLFVRVDDAVRLLCNNHVQMLPVFEGRTGTVLYLLGLKRIAASLQKQIRYMPIPPWMIRSVKEANVGAWGNIIKVSPSTSLLEAMDRIIERDISSLPVVREDNHLLNVLSKSDIVYCALQSFVVLDSETKQQPQTPSGSTDKGSGSMSAAPVPELMSAQIQPTRMLDVFEQTVGDAIAMRAKSPFATQHGATAMAFSRSTDTVIMVLDKIVSSQCRCVYAINEQGECEGAISVSDILRYMVLELHDNQFPPATAKAKKDAVNNKIATLGTTRENPAMKPNPASVPGKTLQLPRCRQLRLSD